MEALFRFKHVRNAGLLIVALVALTSWPDLTNAQQEQAGQPEISELTDRISTLEDELRLMREQLDSSTDKNANTGNELENEDKTTAEVTEPDSSPCCNRCGRFSSCSCPLDEAPCIECPRVSTASPNFNLQVFGRNAIRRIQSWFADGVAIFSTLGVR